MQILHFERFYNDNFDGNLLNLYKQIRAKLMKAKVNKLPQLAIAPKAKKAELKYSKYN